MKRFFVSAFLLALTAGSMHAASVYEDECSVTASGWVHSSELGSFRATLTVTGPCDARLADALRNAIAELRAAFE